MNRYKSEKVVFLNESSLITTVGELKKFIKNNIFLDDEVLRYFIKIYLDKNLKIDNEYMTKLITSTIRKTKIDNLLK